MNSKDFFDNITRTLDENCVRVLKIIEELSQKIKESESKTRTKSQGGEISISPELKVQKGEEKPRKIMTEQNYYFKTFRRRLSLKTSPIGERLKKVFSRVHDKDCLHKKIKA